MLILEQLQGVKSLFISRFAGLVAYWADEGVGIMAHENLLATINALRLPELEYSDTWDPKPYKNRRGVWGLSVSFWSASQHHLISVHNCACVLTPLGLAHLIEGIESLDEWKFGVYANRKAILGFYATARSTRELDGSTNHWFMIARSPERDFLRVLRAKSCPSEEEEDLLSYLEMERSGL